MTRLCVVAVACVLAGAAFTPHAVQSQAGNEPAPAQGKALGSALNDWVFTPVPSCRLLDTRPGSGVQGDGDGPLAPGTPYAFSVTNLCGVPATAKAVSINFIAVSAAANGNLRTWPWDATNPPQPGTAVITYTSGFNTSNGVVIPICNTATASGGNCTEDLFVQTNASASHVVADVFGYFAAPDPGPAVAYTRWGRTTCPAGTTLVYAGFAGGNHYSHTGGGASTLCLTGTPTWLAFDDGSQNGALVYGTEYQMTGTGLSGTLGALHGFDAACAVCLRTSASVVLMVPGTAACPASWTLEYAGYLMSTHWTQAAGGETVCVDQSPEVTGSSVGAPNGHLWYPTEAECGALPCPPYVQDRELACSVCSR